MNATTSDAPTTATEGGERGLKQDALGFVSSVVIGVASTAPGYSLAASLGLVVAITGVGLQAPAIFLVAFVPMLLIASAYYYMNRADPDCGTTFGHLRHRHRALGAHAALPARRGGRDARAVRPQSRSSRSRSATPGPTPSTRASRG